MTVVPFDDGDDFEVSQSMEMERRQVVTKIVKESGNLVDELLAIIYSNAVDEQGRPIVEPRIKLSAIGMLLDRGIPKLAVDGNKSEVIEESRTRKKIREEIEGMMKNKKKDEGE